MTDQYYWCVVCSEYIEGNDIDNRHTSDGEDCHAECCPFCHESKEDQ